MPIVFDLTFAGVPFVSDRSQSIKLTPDLPPGIAKLISCQQADQDIYEEVQRTIPLEWLHDFSPPANHTYRYIDAVARQDRSGPTPEVGIGRWYYPNGASRWSVFRGLMTSAMVKQVMDTTGGIGPASFVMQASPDSPATYSSDSYKITTQMYFLPPRCLGEHGGSFPGLYLVTLVDDRWYFQGTKVTLHPTSSTTWQDLIEELATALDVTINHTDIDSVYLQPEPDSQLWCNELNAGPLLDAIAYNIGRVVVREYDGTYSLLTWTETQTRIATNRGDDRSVVRMAGGDIFTSGVNLPVGNLAPARNTIIPQRIDVSFPKYITGNDPVPHFANIRTSGNQPTAWWEDSYGSTFVVPVGVSGSSVNVSGLTGTSTNIISTTCKATYALEANLSGQPVNYSGCKALAYKLAGDMYDSLVIPRLDEVYPGTYAWTPEGGHDLIFTYSERLRQGSLRVRRCEWNSSPDEFQHSTVGVAYPTGVGGKTVAQTWRDTSGNVSYGTNLVTVHGTPIAVDSTNAGINEVIIDIGSADGVTEVCPLYETITSCTLSYVDGSGNIVDQNLGNSGNVPMTGVSGGCSLGFVNPVWNSGNIGSGQIGQFHLASGAVNSGHIGSGAVGTNQIVSGSVTNTRLASLSIRSGHLFSALESVSDNIKPVFGCKITGVGNIAPGTLSLVEMASGNAVAGSLAWSTLGRPGNISSGTIADVDIAPNGIVSGHLASGAVPTNLFARSGITANYNILSGGANGVWAHSDGTTTLPSVALPGAGLFRVYGMAAVALQCNSGSNGNINARLYNTTAGAVVNTTEIRALLNNDASRVDASFFTEETAFFSSGHTIQLQMNRDTGTFTTALALATSGNTVKIGYNKLGP